MFWHQELQKSLNSRKLTPSSSKENADLFGYIKTVRAYMPILELQTNVPLINTILGNPLIRKAMAPTASDIFGMGKMMGVAKSMARERFGPDPKVREDMLGSFVKHGMNQAEAESEALLQMYVVFFLW